MSLKGKLADNRVLRSVIRHGYPDTNRNRALAVMTNLLLHLHPVKVRKRAIAFRRTLYLGGLSLGCLAILVTSGVLLMFYFRPAAPQAYHDMQDLAFVVPGGRFLRSLHRLTAHAMVLLVFAHMALTFYRRAFRPPREFNWVIGVGLLIFVLALSYTGYLLPWDQQALWAVTVGGNLIAAIPMVGKGARFLLLGGDSVGEAALLRFYVLHCVVLPLFLVIGVAQHLWRVRKDGGIYLPTQPDEEERTDEQA